jgi:hypothetical protein
MLRTPLRRPLLVMLTCVWLIHLTVTTVHAQQPTPASPAEPAQTAEPAPAETWHPRHFGPMHPQPRAATPQELDVERLPDEEPPAQGRHTGLLIAGAATFFTSYLLTAIAAAMVSTINASDCQAGDIMEPCHDGTLMLVPLVGLFLTNRSLGTQLLFAGPQILGALLAVAGIFHYASRPMHLHERASLVVYPVPLPAGGVLTATLTF